MALTLQRFANGDTNYIAKHNANADGLEAAVNGLQTQLATSFGASISIGDALLSIFGGSLALIGSVSYTATTSGSTLTVGPGYLWRPDTGVVQNGAGGVLNFSGVAAGIFYVVPDATGAATRASTAAGATHTVVWSGSSFTSVTRTAAVFLNASDDAAALVSTALGATYVNLDARLEAGEIIVAARYRHGTERRRRHAQFLRRGSWHLLRRARRDGRRHPRHHGKRGNAYGGLVGVVLYQRYPDRSRVLECERRQCSPGQHRVGHDLRQS